MKLIRNITGDGSCKYALIRLDKMRDDKLTYRDLLKQLGPFKKYFELADLGSQEEAFVIKLKDVNSPYALVAYADSAFSNGDEELSKDVLDLINRAGENSPFCKMPD